MTHLGTIGLALALSRITPAVAAGPSYPFQACFETTAALHDVPLDLMLAVAATESNWDPDARSHANAHGIMQIQWPGTARHLGVEQVAELYKPCLNIELGGRYLRELLDRHDDDTTWALAAYNYGPTRIAANPTLPAGALRYVATVKAHRARIQARSHNGLQVAKEPRPWSASLAPPGIGRHPVTPECGCRTSATWRTPGALMHGPLYM